MKTNVDVLTALIAVKDLEIKTLKERVKWLEDINEQIIIENNQLYLFTGQQAELLNKSQKIGYKNEKQ